MVLIYKVYILNRSNATFKLFIKKFNIQMEGKIKCNTDFLVINVIMISVVGVLNPESHKSVLQEEIAKTYWYTPKIEKV